MKFLHSLLIFAATVLAANPQLLGGLHDRAVYPEEGEVCCRRDGAKNCICVARSNNACDKGICIK
ncbi:hypothetical protein CPLU01_12390 [Colletotrichum plurivorum]|uniref:Uncharacterized protein n=1 Tax=Colletotrichum plurivorum TaxID=2175906 RepID=A0A8H6N651_9PEZI|nr:hypothetical protein CPLU01_12390 [Colletotrichum plurivorum]